MQKNKLILILGLALLILSCSKGKKLESKGFAVSEVAEDEEGKPIDGLKTDTLKFETRPRNVLLTANPNHRLTPVYKVNYTKKTKKPFTGSNSFHTNWSEYGESKGNQWNHNYMPGFEAVYGYNFVNVSHYNHQTKIENKFFKKPVLVKTLYYPAFSKDTLNDVPITRKFHMISVYDEDTNKDGFINVKDLKRFYYFDINGENKKPLVPKNFSVMSSEYDPANDFMYVFAKLDQNENGKIENNEETQIFWIDLNTPEEKGVQYQNK
ncbi:EF-hand domain-containing protein [Aquimarina algiphila]|uniref:EF-hand domain-containing protein n=1 Tax=Aquimarina algiphila TaxID=2047982 RepID=A0A554VHM8_9FLAO|nr:EF-hand domain-containing protein [Aquimarina algiphila]TSE07005.1 EF-hand domain-containing protein [Aquimarina algiphila]